MDIDFVVLWVDGSDPVWQAEKAKYQGKTLDDSNAPNRFRDWGLMPYWFRAVEKFAPWVRKIHFVTCGHVPAFLNLAHPKLHHVKHEGFLPPEVLPTFSSHAIEMNLHRIPGLAEHFCILQRRYVFDSLGSGDCVFSEMDCHAPMAENIPLSWWARSVSGSTRR